MNDGMSSPILYIVIFNGATLIFFAGILWQKVIDLAARLGRIEGILDVTGKSKKLTEDS